MSMITDMEISKFAMYFLDDEEVLNDLEDRSCTGMLIFDIETEARSWLGQEIDKRLLSRIINAIETAVSSDPEISPVCCVLQHNSPVLATYLHPESSRALPICQDHYIEVCETATPKE